MLQAGNGLEALAVADQHSGKIDIVVTDVVMPRMGGPALVEKATTKTPRICSHFYARIKIGRKARLGNFPQAFTHLALISAAFNPDRMLGR